MPSTTRSGRSRAPRARAVPNAALDPSRRAGRCAPLPPTPSSIFFRDQDPSAERFGGCEVGPRRGRIGRYRRFQDGPDGFRNLRPLIPDPAAALSQPGADRLGVFAGSDVPAPEVRTRAEEEELLRVPRGEYKIVGPVHGITDLEAWVGAFEPLPNLQRLLLGTAAAVLTSTVRPLVAGHWGRRTARQHAPSNEKGQLTLPVGPPSGSVRGRSRENELGSRRDTGP
jgi:hypothetical protein